MSDRPRHQQMDHNPERGAIVIIVAIILPVIFVMAAVVIDLGQLFQIKSRLQGTADASALAGASALPDAANVQARAASYAGFNYPDAGTVVANADVVVGTWSANTFTAGGSNPNAVRVTARRAQANNNRVSLFLGGFVGRQFADVSATAVAVISGTGHACIYQLNPNAKPGLEISSNSHVTAACGVKVNSTMGPSNGCESLVMGSGSSLTVTNATIDVVSSCTKITGSTVTPQVTTSAPSTPDPLAGLAAPVPGGCDWTDRKVDSGTGNVLTPGVYCKGLIISGSNTTVTLSPGLYIMRGGGFNVESGARVLSGTNGTAQGVTVFNTCNTSTGCSTPSQTTDAKPIQITSGTRVSLSAPNSGSYRGILFFVDRNMGIVGDNRIASDADSTLDGALYFPTPQFLQFHSNTTVLGKDRVVILAGKLAVTSGANFGLTSLPTSMPLALSSGGPSLSLTQ